MSVGRRSYTAHVRDEAVFDDSSKEFPRDLELSLWEPWEELVLFKHVLQHTHKQVLRESVCVRAGVCSAFNEERSVFV